MSRNLKNYRLTVILGILFCGTFIYDTLLRIQSGISFTDYLFGNNFGVGLYNYIWFKGSLVVKGEIWRVLTWPFLFKGFLYFIIDFSLLILLLTGLERKLGTVKTTIRVLVMHLVYTGMMWLTRGLACSTIDIGIVSINLFLFGLIGLYLTENLIHDVENSKRSKIKEWILIGYVVVNLIYQIVQQNSEYGFLYALSTGIFICCIFNIKMCSISNKEIPIYKKKFCYVTYSIIAISIIIFIFDLVFASNELKSELYSDFSFSKWFNYFMYYTGDNNGAVSKWLCLNYEDLKTGQIWRIFTLVYSHYGFEHILYNMPAIFLSGRYIESKYGSVKTLLIFEGSAFFVSIYACLTLVSSTFSGFGGSSLGIYAFLIVFMLMSFEYGQTSKPHLYEMIYVVFYFIMGNIPGIGVQGDNHLISFLFGLIAFFAIEVYTKSNNKNTLSYNKQIENN
jgi:rhomboid protease GluP